MPKAPVKAPARNARAKPKEEVQRDFRELAEEVESALEAADPKTQQSVKAREAETRAAVEGVTVDSVVRNISALSLDVTRSMNDLSSKLVEQVDLLGSIRDTIRIETAELERIHKIDLAATALDQMVQEHGREKLRLEAEAAAQRAAWADDRQRAEKDQRELEDNLKKQRQREADDFEYKKALERKRAQDKYDEDQRAIEKKNAERQEKLEKSWAEREKAMKDAEAELTRLRQESAGFADRLQKDIEQAVADARLDAKRNHDQATALLKKDAETERKIAEMQIRTLEETAIRQTARIEALEAQLQLAKQQVQDIAVKAIEGASDAKALSHINKIAMEQAKNRE